MKDVLYEIFKPNSDYLYHVTHRDNLQSIKSNGLVPKFGDLVRSTSGFHTWQDHLKHGSLGGWNDDSDEIGGVLFFSEEPKIGYYDIRGKKHTKEVILNDILLCVVEKNDSIYQYVNHGRGDVLDYKGNKVYNITWGRRNSIPTEKLPYFIEPSDWFSFEWQDPVKLLHGKELFEFLREKYSDQIADIE